MDLLLRVTCRPAALAAAARDYPRVFRGFWATVHEASGKNAYESGDCPV